MLAGVPAVRDAEADLKVEGFEQSVSEEMPLNQTKAVQCLAAHRELQPEREAADELKYYSFILVRRLTIVSTEGLNQQGNICIAISSLQHLES